MSLFCESDFLLNFLGVCPSSCAPLWRRFHKIPHGLGGKGTISDVQN